MRLYHIESKTNKTVKFISGLMTADKKFRDESRSFVVEGEKLVSSVPEDWEVSLYVCSEAYYAAKATEKLRADIPIYIFRDDIFKSVSGTVNPQGILAVCGKRLWTLENILISHGGKDKSNLFVVICESLRDPGNLGAVIRTADACACDGIILSADCVDFYNPKVVRASAGSVLNIPIFLSESLRETVSLIKSKGLTVYGAHLKGAVSLYEADFRQSFAVVIGNEAQGLSDEISNLAHKKIKIPIPGGAESLNASVASGVIMYEAFRQRSLPISRV